MTGEELEAIREACEKATPGPWAVTGEGIVYSRHDSVPGAEVCDPPHYEDAVFIRDARSWVPALLDEIERLRAALAFYADPLNWSNDDWGIPAVCTEYAESGKRARDALGGVS